MTSPRKKSPGPNGKLHAVTGQKAPWNALTSAIWLASTLKLHRNVDKYPFPGKLDGPRRNQLITLFQNSCKELTSLEKPVFYKAEELDRLEKEFLSEHYLMTQSLQQAHTGEGFIIDGSGQFFAAVNVGDHLLLSLTDCREELEEAWSKLLKVEAEFGKSVNYAFNPRFGFLSADPAVCGTGLIVTLYLHVPGLIHSSRLQEVLTQQVQEEVIASSLTGDPEAHLADIVTLHNSYTLGVSEENILTALHSVATKMIVAEQSARTYIAGYERPKRKN